ncbi:MAG: flagellar biosynthetic protein FliQ [Kangiellaceae bacterium]|jgi:flagellar biosynthetic protein FliQ|nr:flagellar biosynthetic protein FliQ [Kangiellaceae bacterium]|tara:strand:+ start:1679 stop:1948 length:270 start_codon:yes stop_codon:yes gene_type:complete
MTPEVVIQIYQEALGIVVMVVVALAMPGLIVGLIIATFQAATSINEQTLSFLPRLVITLGAMTFLGHWIFGTIMEFMTRLIHDIPSLIG